MSDISPDLPGDSGALIVELGDEPLRRLRQLEALANESAVPVLVIVAPDQLPLLETSVGVTDFMVTPIARPELRLRLRRLTRAAGTDEVHHFKDLELNLLTYQATLGNRPLDLTYMEYELLRFFMERQARVWT